ncbi:MAG: (2Fe-2S)-binding protein [Burkholderiales bacterium]
MSAKSGDGAAAVRLNVNGTEYEISAAADTPLLYVLRNQLGLKAAHFGCGTGECGACRVLIDAQAVASCDTPLWAAAGRRITTAEGLGDAAHPHPLQSALIAEQAGQCGYCLPGILISAAALLGQNAVPSEAEVRAALDRNLCRCGSHNRIVRAVLRAAQGKAA